METRENVSYVFLEFFSHASICMHAGHPVCVFPDMGNQDISVTERAVDQERDWTTGVGRGPDKIQGASP